MGDLDGDNVIYLSVVAPKYRVVQCKHLQVEVDEQLAEVVCTACGEKLNPIQVLARYAREESILYRRIEELKQTRETLEKRSRCKCDHCGRMTRIWIR